MRLVEWASGLAHRHLGERRADTLRAYYLGSRTRLAALLGLVHGSFDAQALRVDFERRLPHDFDILMVHSSVNAMKPMFTGGALDLVHMLLEFCGPSRTLVMPAFYFGENGEGAHAAFKRNPRFDLTRTPSQMGLMTEMFRRSPGVLHSRHPVYRVAAKGPLAHALIEGHDRADTPAGRGTPFEFMARQKTLVIGIGKSVDALTQAHHTEQLMGDEFPVPSRVNPPLAMTLVERGQEMPYELRSRSVDGRFEILRIRSLMSRESLKEWTFHGAPFFAAAAADVTAELVAAARRGQTLYVT